MKGAETAAGTVSSSGDVTGNTPCNVVWVQWCVELGMGCEGGLVIIGTVPVQQTALLVGSSAFLLHAEGTHCKSNPDTSNHDTVCLLFILSVPKENVTQYVMFANATSFQISL
jgi:hypothetical protein